MILTVEIPHQGKPLCWFAFSEDDFIRKVKATLPATDTIIFSAGTARELLALQGLTPDSPGLQGTQPDLLKQALAYGWDTVLYRADHLLAPGIYQREAVSEFVAHVAAVAQQLRACRVYRDEDQAHDALYTDPLYAEQDGFHAHMALREA